MAQAAIERAPSIPWNSNPLFYIRDLIANDPKFTPRARSHALLMVEEIKAMCGPDPRQQMVVAAALESYATWLRLTTAAGQAKGDTSRTEAMRNRAARALTNGAQWIRLAGLSAKPAKDKRGRSRAGMFTAPRPPMPSELSGDSARPLVED